VEEDLTSVDEKMLKKLNPHVYSHCISAVPNQAQGAKPTELELARTIIIRHANSTFNNRWHSIEKEIEEGTAT
jgi:hypothetical protein